MFTVVLKWSTRFLQSLQNFLYLNQVINCTTICSNSVSRHFGHFVEVMIIAKKFKLVEFTFQVWLSWLLNFMKGIFTLQGSRIPCTSHACVTGTKLEMMGWFNTKHATTHALTANTSTPPVHVMDNLTKMMLRTFFKSFNVCFRNSLIINCSQWR